MNRVYVYMILFLFFTACAVQRKGSVTHIKNLNDLEDNYAIYALPRTVLNIAVEATRTTVIPGPFHEYAGKYLSIRNVPDSEKIEWNISGIKIDIHNEADPDYYYSVSNNNAGSLDRVLAYLAGNNLILSPDRFYSEYSFSEIDTSGRNKILYKDVSVKRNFYFGSDTTYKRTFIDSAYIKVPVIRKQLVKKTMEEKAEEAANYIIKIRKRRFKLVSGQYEQIPDGEAMAIAVEKLDNTENEYLSLFTGKKYIDRYSKTIQYVPDGSRQVSKEILFRFSGTEGFIDSKGAKGIPVIIEIEDLNRTVQLEDLSMSGQELMTGNNMPVRLPDLAEIRIMEGTRVINRTKLPVFQYGITVPFSFKD
jgi:hypothetical protein